MKTVLLGYGKKGLFALLALVLAALLPFLQTMTDDETLRFAMGIGFALAVLCFFACLQLMAASRWLRALGIARRDIHRFAWVTLAFAIAGVVCIYLFLRTEEDIKTFDASLYWIRVIEDRALISRSILDYLAELRQSLSRGNTYLAALPLLPISYLTGVQFTGFCQSVLLVYYIPACFFLALFALRLNRMWSHRKPGSLIFALCFGVCALSVCFLWPLLNGYLDVCGVLVMALLLGVTLHWDMLAFDWRKNIVVALLCLLMVMLRRWFAAYIVGFFVAFIVYAIVMMLGRRPFAWRRLGAFLMNIVMIVALDAAILYALIPDVVVSWLGGSNGPAMAAFRTTGLGANLWTFAQTNGIFWLAFALAGMFVLLYARETRAITLRLVGAMLISVVGFGLTQNIEYIHYYLALPTLCILICGLAEFAARLAIAQEKPIIVIAILLICGINIPLSYSQSLHDYALLSEPLTASLRYYPRQNPFYTVARHVASDLEQLVRNDPAYVYVVGDIPLDYEVLKRAYMPDVVDAAPSVLPQHSDDLRDGFPSQAFFAEYLLVNRPYRSTYPQTQQVNYQLYELIENNPIAEDYYALDSIYPTNTGESILYKKIRAIDRTVVDVLKERIRHFYPDDPYVYEPGYLLALFAAEDGTRYAYDPWTHAISLSGTTDAPVRFRLNDTAGFRTLTLGLDSAAQGLTMTIEDQNGVLETLDVTAGYAIYTLDIGGSDYAAVTIDGTQGAGDDEVMLTLRTDDSGLSEAPAS